MALGRLWTIAYRDLGRNRRRSILSLAAVGLGLALLLIMHGFVEGTLDDTIENSIRLETGHVQIRSNTFEPGRLSLKWSDLLENPAALAARAATLPEVKAAAPVLWAGGVYHTADDSAGLQIYGVDTTSPLYDPFREAMVDGSFVTPEDRNGILIGQNLANNLGLTVGQKANLVIIDGDGQPNEGTFEVRGIFFTGVTTYDQNAAFLPLDKLQDFVHAADHASAIVIQLHNKADSNKVAGVLGSEGLNARTWEEINAVFLQGLQTALNFYIVLDMIVILVVAVIIVNTLLMSVFERIREMGILASLGMKGRQIMLMFLMEAAVLGLAGIAVGIVLGAAGVAYLSRVGVYIGDMSQTASGMALGTTMYAHFDPPQFVSLSLLTLAIVLLASLYPAWFAARREPADALRAS